MSQAHQGHSSGMKGKEPWNKGLTKDLDSRVVSGGRTKGSIPWIKGKTSAQYSQLIRSEEYRVLQRRIQKALWNDPEHAKKCLHRRTPSGPEQIFIGLCKAFQYVGNGVLTIDGKNPDFVCITDDHKLVEIWGEYYKRGRNPQDLIDFYKVRGYQCLVIWASELKHLEQVVAKIKKFEEV